MDANNSTYVACLQRRELLQLAIYDRSFAGIARDFFGALGWKSGGPTPKKKTYHFHPVHVFPAKYRTPGRILPWAYRSMDSDAFFPFSGV